MASSSVIVATAKPEQYLDRCLASVADQAAEIIVVDNASEGPAAAAIARKYGARLLRQEENLGFAGAVNVGARQARHDFIALLNDDAFADPGWLAGSERVLEDPGVGVVMPKLLFAWRHGVVRLDDRVSFAVGDPRPLGRHVNSITVGPQDVTEKLRAFGTYPRDEGGFWTSGGATLIVPLWENRVDEVRVDGEIVPVESTYDVINSTGHYLHAGGWCGDIGYGARDDGSYDAAAERFSACGTAVVTRRETWERLGGLADVFIAYYEDTDLSWRMQLEGLRVRYEPSMVVRHVHAQTSVEGSLMWIHFVARNRVLCFARNAPARVVARLLSELPPLPPKVGRSLAKRLPVALGGRRVRSRHSESDRRRVWAQWAGVNTPP